jgi:ABC-2 type transport system ATP-binding protein
MRAPAPTREAPPMLATAEATPARGARLSPATAKPVVRVRGLQKRYGDNHAVRGVDLEVHAGEIFAFLGPNGAGKTTTVEILEGYRSRDGGEVEVLGRDPHRATREWRSRIGVVLQTCAVQPELTVGELLELYSSYYPRPLPVAQALELVGLRDERDRRAGALSGGQQRRLDVGLALVGNPELLFLDEPTTGFDPSARHHTWEVIAGLREIGKTVFLTTHYMDEAQHLADRVAVMRAGEIIALGRPDDLGGRDLRPAEIRFVLPAGWSLGDIPDVPAGGRSIDGYRVLISTTDAVIATQRITTWALDHDIELGHFSVAQPTLEDIYLELTGSEEHNHVSEEVVR